jgi:uncharacterized membrane protein YobD (UPF0266 family)
MDPKRRDAIIFLIAIAILISQSVVAVLGRSPSELMVGTALMLLGVPIVAGFDDKRNDK